LKTNLGLRPAGNLDLAGESVGKLEWVLSLDGDFYDAHFLIFVFTPLFFGGDMLENLFIEMDLARSAFDDDDAAVSWFGAWDWGWI
jgi:hypothetical protein